MKSHDVRFLGEVVSGSHTLLRAAQSTTFGIFQRHEVSVDVVATSEVSVSLTLDPSRIWSRDLIDDELDSLVSSFTDIAKVQPDHMDNVFNRSRNSK